MIFQISNVKFQRLAYEVITAADKDGIVIGGVVERIVEGFLRVVDGDALSSLP